MKTTFTKRVQQLIRAGDAYLASRGSRHFPQVARDLLMEARPFEVFDQRELLMSSFSFQHEQNFKRFEFSDLPLTVARGKHCFVDVYFWRRRPTTIHNHHFTGAFQCLQGLNVETEFSWNAERKLTRFHTLGKLTPVKTNVLRPGDTQAIDLQDKFIHQSHHHADLTINLCFRTPDVKKKNLANFLFSGLKIEKDLASLRRAELLYLCSNFESLKISDLGLKNEDRLNFLLQTLGTTENPRILALQRELERKVKADMGISVSKLLRDHERVLDKIQQGYD